jgi:hypothetical protein
MLFLFGGRNRLAVVLNWSWLYFSFPPGTRLIIGSSSEVGAISEGGASGGLQRTASWPVVGCRSLGR